MKTTVIFFVFFLLSGVLSAQPVITNNEFYNTGDVIQMVNCDASGVIAGAPGAGIKWDFSTLSATGGFSTTSVLLNTTSSFSTSGLMEVNSDGTTDYLEETNDNSYVNGIYNSNTDLTAYYTNYDVAERPVTYNTVYIDHYFIDIPAAFTYGTGQLTQTGDSYGTLILPTGVFTNVLRVRKVQEENDTVGTPDGNYTLYTITVSYLWFDGNHNAPLLRMDSISNIIAQTQDVMYLSIPTGINNVVKDQNTYSSYFDNSGGLVINGFQPGRNYVVALYNIIGNRIFTTNVAATWNSQRFDINSTLIPGVYLVSITPKNTSSDYPTVLKIAKSY